MMRNSINTLDLRNEDIELIQRIHEAGLKQIDGGDLSLEFLFPEDVDLGAVGKLHVMKIVKLHESTMFGVRGSFTIEGLKFASGLQSHHLPSNNNGN